MNVATLRKLNEARRAKRAVALATWLNTGDSDLITPDDRSHPALATALADTFGSGRPALLEVDGQPVFLSVFNPPLRMIVVGAVHIAEPLAALARELDYDVVVVDPRRAYADAERFHGVRMIESWPDDAMARLCPDGRTAVVTLAHDPRIDDPALAAALSSPAFYIGALGSVRTHAKRVERLRASGFDNDQISRVKGPAGLDIGALTPAEIALSIMAQAVAAHRARRA